MNLNKTATALSALLLLAATIGPAMAQQTPKFVPGNVTHTQTSKLTSEIHWYQNLPTAEADARRQGKLVFWMHMLGQLDGTT
jgi:hypothetical protein